MSNMQGERKIITSNTAVSIGLVISFLAAAFAFGVTYNQVKEIPQIKTQLAGVREDVAQIKGAMSKSVSYCPACK